MSSILSSLGKAEQRKLHVAINIHFKQGNISLFVLQFSCFNHATIQIHVDGCIYNFKMCIFRNKVFEFLIKSLLNNV